MTQQTLASLRTEQNRMNRQATWVVLLLASAIHIGINMYAYISNNSFLKIEAPVITAITVVAIVLGFRFFSSRAH